jgi:hypothetical protein
MNRIGTKLIEKKKAALDQDYKTGSTSQGRDLLTLLIKSNIQAENEGHRMSDEEVLSRKSNLACLQNRLIDRCDRNIDLSCGRS